MTANSGGGAIAQGFANASIDAIDVGIGLLNLHSTMEQGFPGRARSCH